LDEDPGQYMASDLHPLAGSEDASPEQQLLCAITTSDLEDIDIDVLLGNLTRQEAADRLGMSYPGYKKRLSRRVKKIRKDYTFLLDKLL